jgi:hypothetical protein
MGDDGGVLRRVDGNRLETVDTVESVGDGGVDDGNGDGNEDWEREIDAVRGRNLPDLSQRSDTATIDRSSCGGGQR